MEVGVDIGEQPDLGGLIRLYKKNYPAGFLAWMIEGATVLVLPWP